MMDNLATVILAAGKGTRMKSNLVKVLHTIAGLPMLSYSVQAAKAVGSSRTVIVTGHQKEEVEKAFRNSGAMFALQREMLGSAHAVAASEELLKDFQGNILILCGDVPLITIETLKHFLKSHTDIKSSLSVLSVTLENPFGYGRILRDKATNFLGIVEERDASSAQKQIHEINTGIYCCEASFLFAALKQVGQDNSQGEYYLPDIVTIALSQNKKVHALETDNPHEVMGINDRIGLSMAEKLMRQRILNRHMKNGITIIDPDSTYIDAGVKIEKDTVIYPNTILRGNSIIGEGCLIEINCSISSSVVGKGAHIKPSCVINESSVGDRAAIGPFAHLRPQALIGEDAKIGNFVEIKKSHIGNGSKASHLTYIGDTTVGKGVNIGAGTITCNYDGKQKHQTIIEDEVFVGSNTAFVAPVKIGEKALIGAGSTITKDVSPGALAVSRTKQRNYNNYFKTEK